MTAVIAMRTDYSGDELRRLAIAAGSGAQARRLMSLAAIADGKSRSDAAAVGLMDRQTLRDWVIRFNNEGPDGLIDLKLSGRTPKLNTEQKRELGRLVEDGPQSLAPDLVRWRRADLVDAVKQLFCIDCHETTIGRILKELGFSHMSPRPQHPKQDEQVIEGFKKTLSKG